MKAAIILTTENNCDAIDYWLFINSEQLKKNGFDLLVYDYSKNDSTSAVVWNFISEGYNNIYYKKVSNIVTNDLKSDYSQITDCYENYDYIWVCNQYRLVNENALRTVKSFMMADRDIIILKNDNYYSNNYYRKTCDFTCNNFSDMVIAGSIVFKRKVLRAIIEKNNYSEIIKKPIPFFLLSSDDMNIVFMHGTLFSENLKVKCVHDEDSIAFWQQCIIYINSLTDANIRNRLLNNIRNNPFMNNLDYIYNMRLNNTLNYRSFLRYKKDMNMMTNISTETIKMISICPKKIVSDVKNHNYSTLVITMIGFYCFLKGKPWGNNC